ncbi:PorV/PorQ family protein [Draconibacterium halophilum]|uniref:Type IX secretion system membrane protein PorP/SprF n=1 Tax=Draconibacterium halophilum TaxID=2706887 RepID=A0A6C0RB79_9BACT|nr:hypothetical protein [Draconibacterium halophilum]QIA07025.1 hypothetical protein G0Q07_04405 [Draconibacterium halophilum]
MHKPFYILLACFTIIASVASSQNYTGGARSVALSNAFVSIPDSWSTFHNQATLAQLNNFSAGIFYESKFGIDEFELAASSIVLPTNTGTFGLSFYQFGKGIFKAHKLGLAYAKPLSERLNASIQFDYFAERMPENADAFSFLTFEIGASYKLTEKITLGVHSFNPVKNGYNYREEKTKLPSIYRLGAHYAFDQHVLVSFETQKESERDVLIKSGLEFMPLENLAFRFGISGRPVQYTAGIGYIFKNISTDIAFSYHGNLGFTPSVSIQYNLK